MTGIDETMNETSVDRPFGGVDEMRAKRVGILFFVFLLTVCVGCTSSGPTTPANACPDPNVNLDDYVIGPGDTLDILVWRNEELSATLPVRPDGKISAPLVEDLQASGQTPSNLALSIERALSSYLRDPQVSVIVTAQGVASQIQVIGEVTTPQALSYYDNLRLLDVVVAVGGLTEFAAGNRTLLVRQSGATQYECRVKVEDLLDGNMQQNIRVYPGDVIIVPESRL